MLDPYLGQLELYPYNFVPEGWLPCDGREIPVQQNVALFSLLGTIYGGNGTTTFRLPDLRSRTLIGQGQGPGLPLYVMGQTGGSPSVTLTPSQLPSHTHQGKRILVMGGSRGRVSAMNHAAARGEIAPSARTLPSPFRPES